MDTFCIVSAIVWCVLIIVLQVRDATKDKRLIKKVCSYRSWMPDSVTYKGQQVYVECEKEVYKYPHDPKFQEAFYRTDDVYFFKINGCAALIAQEVGYRGKWFIQVASRRSSEEVFGIMKEVLKGCKKNLCKDTSFNYQTDSFLETK